MKSRWRVLLAALLLLTLGCGDSRVLSLFATGPQVAGGTELPVSPPDLRVPSSKSWDGEENRALLVIEKGGRVQVRLSYEPADGGARVRELAPDEWVPEPKSGVEPAILIVADHDVPWIDVLRGIHGWYLLPRLYLGGRGAATRLGALPFLVNRPEELVTFGFGFSASDIVGGVSSLEVRVERRDGGVRYRWRHAPIGAWALPTPVRDHGATSRGFLRSLRARLASVSRPGRGGPRWMVFLQVRGGTTYGDVLRAVEAANGDPDILFIWHPHPAQRLDNPLWRLPIPASEADAAATVESGDLPAGVQPPWIVNLAVDGTIHLKGREADLTRIQVPSNCSYVLIRAAEAAPWRMPREILDRVRAAGKPAWFCFREEPGLPYDREVEVPAPPVGAALVDVRLRPLPEELPGEQVRLTVPADATAGEVARVVLRLVRLGAKGIAFLD